MASAVVWLKGGFNKWRVAFAAFAVVYLLFLVFGVFEMYDVAHTSIYWDEITHLNGGVLLLRGNFEQYLSWNSFYPPMYDLFTSAFFGIGGISVFTGRLVAVIFSLLSLYAVFEFTYRLYGPKTALLSSLLLAVMPGYVWLSRMAMIETMMVFFFTVSAFFFFFWLKEPKTKFLALSILTLCLGICTKYQTIIVVGIAIVSMAFLGRNYLKQKFRTVPRFVITVIALLVPLVLVLYGLYAMGWLNQWLYAMNIGNPFKTGYSTRFWIPVFYLIEMVEPYFNMHPISYLLYGFGLAGLGLFAWRRRLEDKYLLIWFVVVYVFFTLIPNREWRYMLPVFPVLTISAASLIISALGKAQNIWINKQLSVSKKRATQIAAGALIAFTLVGFAYSVYDAYSWVANSQIALPVQEATDYVANRLQPTESVMVLCAFNLFSQDIVRFYFYTNSSINVQVYQYPEYPVDTYTPQFNATQLIAMCEQYNVKYLLVDEYGRNFHYFNTTLTFNDVIENIFNTGRFSWENEDGFGEEHAKILVIKFE